MFLARTRRRELGVAAASISLAAADFVPALAELVLEFAPLEVHI
jgi:hypothetical protein